MIFDSLPYYDNELEQYPILKEKVERERRGKGRRVSAGFIEGSDRSEAKRANRRVVSTGMFDTMRALVVTEEPEEFDQQTDEESIDDDELPDWAKRTSYEDDPLGAPFSAPIVLNAN